MPATTTLATLLTTFAEETGLGLVIDAGTGVTTTITETDTGVSELRGPFTGSKIPIGSPVTVITGGTVGEDSYVSNFVPSTGVVTLSPAITTGATGFIIWEPSIEHGKNVEKAFSRAHQNRVGRWELRPLTYVPDGDLQGTTVTDYWTAAANGTAAYASAQIYPAGSAADAFGQVGLNRLVQLTTSGGASTLTGNGMRWPVSTQQRSWYFLTAIRLVSGTGTAELKMRDNTNSADITLQVTRGNDSNTLTTTTLGDFMLCEGTFQMPATCAEVAPQLSLSATGLVAQMTPIIMFPLNVTSFPLPNRIETLESVGNFFTGWSLRSPGTLADVFRAGTEPLEHRIHDYGDHRTVTFDALITRPVWYEEYVNGGALTAMTDTTTFAADRLQKWARFETYDFLMRRELGKRKVAENGVPLPSMWRTLRNAALKAAENSGYEPALKNVTGRR